jgi:hypothetical protein
MLAHRRARRSLAAVFLGAALASCAPHYGLAPTARLPIVRDPSAYVTYIPGDLPIILSAPHGGYLAPPWMPRRTCGTLGGATGAADAGTQEFTQRVADELESLTGRRPHVVLSLLRRDRLDPNRPIDEAVCGNSSAAAAYRVFHSALDTAQSTVVARWGSGLYLDLHRNDHVAERWTEFDVGLTPADLARSDLDLDTESAKSTVRSLVADSRTSLSALLRGPFSLGARLTDAGYRAVPSPAHRDPAGGAFFFGSYDSARHGSRSGGRVDSILVENSYAYLEGASMSAYAHALAVAIVGFMRDFYGFELARR